MNRFGKVLLLLILAAFALPMATMGQVDRSADHFKIVIGKKEGNILIKAIPNNKETWFYATRKGLRFSMAKREGDTWSAFEPLAAGIIRPASADAFLGFREMGEFPRVMSSIVHEQDYVPAVNTIKDYQEVDQEIAIQYTAYILLSCYHPKLSEMSGLQVDLGNLPEGQYQIKVEVVGNAEMTSTLTTRIAPGGDVIYHSPKLDAKPGDGYIELTWEFEPYQDHIAAYQLFKSEDGKAFHRVANPIIANLNTPYGEVGQIKTVDSIPENYRAYQYHIKGYDPFGYFTHPSNTVEVAGKDLTPPRSPDNFSVVHSSPAEATFTWSITTEEDLLGFQIIGSDTEVGNFELIHQNLLPPDSRSYTYLLTRRFYRYYRLMAVDTARNASLTGLAYLTVVDTIPPPIPTGLWGDCDTNRVVMLSWDSSEVADFRGYRVQRSYHRDGGFYPLTSVPITEPFFRDTLPRKLDKRVYYKVSALDKNFNHSKFTSPLEVKIPDLIPPTPPMLEAANLLDNGDVELKWRPSSHRDIAHYSILYQAPSDSIWTKLLQTKPKAVQAVDKDFKNRGESYLVYGVMAEDSSGNQSEISNVMRVFADNQSRVRKGEITRVEYTDGVVELGWPESISESAHVIVVYRASENGKFASIGRSSTSGFTDTNVSQGVQYRYKILVMEENGFRWQMSDLREVSTH